MTETSDKKMGFQTIMGNLLSVTGVFHHFDHMKSNSRQSMYVLFAISTLQKNKIVPLMESPILTHRTTITWRGLSIEWVV